MNNYTFIIYVGGVGETPEYAWEQCQENIITEMGRWGVPAIYEISDERGEPVIPEGWQWNNWAWCAEHKAHPYEDWRHLVAQGATTLGYYEWVHAQAESDWERDVRENQ